MAAQSKSKTSKSGDPRVRAAQARAAAQDPGVPLAPTPASEWVSHTTGDDVDIQLPSGNVARVRRVGPEAFMTQGIMPDSISPIVEKAIRSKKGLKPQAQAELAKDPKQLGAMMEMLDRTLCYAVLQPKVEMPPACVECDQLDNTATEVHHDESLEDYHEFQPAPREPGVLYADRVDLDDKMFVLNFVVGGTGDLQRFRREQREAVGSVAAV